jgi:hypothetical protein
MVASSLTKQCGWAFDVGPSYYPVRKYGRPTARGANCKEYYITKQKSQSKKKIRPRSKENKLEGRAKLMHYLEFVSPTLIALAAHALSQWSPSSVLWWPHRRRYGEERGPIFLL